MSLQSPEKIFDFRGLIFMQFTTVTTVISTIFRPGLISLEARASLWIMQCVQMHSGDFGCFTSACILLNLPDIVRAPSVHIPTQFFHSIFASFIKLFKISNINAIAVALSFIGLQTSSSSTADIPSQNRTYAMK
ncbi:uncharacterized protein TNCV_3413011 [Trichonephila clavipes]|uniref:Uncharacterized protein n=1 Tax=Trichonephila clavipes TaxID=2585209 RepID=A0A8X6RFA3_TRICX|nr:uncharacterized protein TNCV_3413011 [Trichonephila clavipes]